MRHRHLRCMQGGLHERAPALPSRRTRQRRRIRTQHIVTQPLISLSCCCFSLAAEQPGRDTDDAAALGGVPRPRPGCALPGVVRRRARRAQQGRADAAALGGDGRAPARVPPAVQRGRGRARGRRARLQRGAPRGAVRLPVARVLRVQPRREGRRGGQRGAHGAALGGVPEQREGRAVPAARRRDARRARQGRQDAAALGVCARGVEGVRGARGRGRVRHGDRRRRRDARHGREPLQQRRDGEGAHPRGRHADGPDGAAPARAARRAPDGPRDARGPRGGQHAQLVARRRARARGRVRVPQARDAPRRARGAQLRLLPLGRVAHGRHARLPLWPAPPRDALARHRRPLRALLGRVPRRHTPRPHARPRHRRAQHLHAAPLRGVAQPRQRDPRGPPLPLLSRHPPAPLPPLPHLQPLRRSIWFAMPLTPHLPDVFSLPSPPTPFHFPSLPLAKQTTTVCGSTTALGQGTTGTSWRS